MKVYEKMDSMFSDCSVYAILKNNNIIGRVLFKHSKSGVVTVFMHEWGYRAVMGKAGGYGYDKKGAALRDAVDSALKNDETKDSELYQALRDVTYNGMWESLLQKAGLSSVLII